MEEIIHKHPGDLSKTLRELKLKNEQDKYRIDTEYLREIKKEWVKDVMGLSSPIESVEIRIHYGRSEHIGDGDTQMTFKMDEIILVAPLLNIKSLDLYVLNEIGSTESELSQTTGLQL